jgi:hypothetical protein
MSGRVGSCEHVHVSCGQAHTSKKYFLRIFHAIECLPRHMRSFEMNDKM